jgi:hypothetical protein
LRVALPHDHRVDTRHLPRLKIWPYMPLVLALGLRLASAPTPNLSYVLIAIYALFGRGGGTLSALGNVMVVHHA